ncbi:hypothetical protein HDK90DRAFT_189882 [Phyllosticta capitalensis]|uniref:Uncharacterized protein n=1 Tax=Phyllosticta capitalensis TaxID=121624 RepID=A0ABR1YWP6_9PEZI
MHLLTLLKPQDLPSDNHQQQFEPSADPWEGQQRFNSVRNHNDTGLGLGSGPHQGYYENTKTFLERHERATKVLKGNEDDDVAAVAVRRHDSPHEGFDTPPKAPTPRRTHARTVSAGSKRSIEEFEADQDEYVNEGVGSAQTVHLANSSNLLDNLTPVKTDKEVLSVTDNGQVGEKEKGLRALMYFRRHLILPQDIDALISRQCESGKPTSRLVAKKHLATATRWQGQILKWVRAQVKSIYDANAPDMLEWEGAKRYDAYTQFFEQDPLGHAKKMWGGGITSYVDFDAIIEPPEGLSPDLRQLLDRWARYLFHCWLKAADASFIFQVAKQHKPDHPELVEATTGKEKLDEFIIWRTMTLNEDMDVPGIKDVPIIVRDRTMHG